jgi:hypothetical protein
MSSYPSLAIRGTMYTDNHINAIVNRVIHYSNDATARVWRYCHGDECTEDLYQPYLRDIATAITTTGSTPLRIQRLRLLIDSIVDPTSIPLPILRTLLLDGIVLRTHSLINCEIRCGVITLDDMYTILRHNHTSLVTCSLLVTYPRNSITVTPQREPCGDTKTRVHQLATMMTETIKQLASDGEMNDTPVTQRLLFARLKKLTLQMATNRLLTMIHAPLLHQVRTRSYHNIPVT